MDKNTEKFYIETFGCQMNEFDSERIGYLMETCGYSRTNDLNSAKIILINTCSVREKADNRLYGHLGNLKSLKINNPDVLICVGGCTAQSLREKIIKEFPYIDIVFGTKNIKNLPDLIKKRRQTNKSICETETTKSFDHEIFNFNGTFKFKANLPIIIGCNNYCSYCIVPQVRGEEMSIPMNLIIEKTENLISKGICEITLLGQNVNSYGKDLKGTENFAELLDNLSKVKGLKRIRFMTSHPKDFSKDIISVIKQNSNIMRHIHLPLQAGSNKILNLMNRKYTREDYFNLYHSIRGELPDCSITTDIIVGFPGENKEDFLETFELVKNLRFDRAFTFIYSKRRGTAAENMQDVVALNIKKQWFNKLVELQNSISLEQNKKMIGLKLEVLVECFSNKKSGQLKGRLENNTIVNFNGDKELIGKFIPVKIKDAKSFYLYGEL
ncbi:MAG: tRNA (N6-isopentenyl adenosine(37)-C2)-methylthiotransferase MiaB [Actinobacteria bacterium]|nr:tRNA (N6-isopentenyl adenosine(37)-C2)-methylthiotransferase MiaB [Actinomycetota bacterium]